MTPVSCAIWRGHRIRVTGWTWIDHHSCPVQIFWVPKCDMNTRFCSLHTAQPRGGQFLPMLWHTCNLRVLCASTPQFQDGMLPPVCVLPSQLRCTQKTGGLQPKNQHEFLKLILSFSSGHPKQDIHSFQKHAEAPLMGQKLREREERWPDHSSEPLQPSGWVCHAYQLSSRLREGPPFPPSPTLRRQWNGP